MALEVSWELHSNWSPEVRIANPTPALLAKYTETEKKFFYDYAEFVVRIVRDESVSNGIRRIISTENLHVEKHVDVRVMVFPARSFRGRTNRTLHGSYSRTASQISLYPLKIPRVWAKNDGQDLFRTPYDALPDRKKRLLYEISENGIATLIHEILHVKFESRGLNSYAEESIVRKLERNYMEGWEPIIFASVRNALFD